MTDVHRIRLRGPWRYQPLARYECRTDGTPVEMASPLPGGGVTTVPSDWSRTPLGADYRGRVRHLRGFSRPTGLESHEIVYLVVEAAVAVGDVCLNGTRLGTVRGGAVPARFDVTTLLQDRNELLIDVTRSPTDEGHSPGQPGGVTGEVRLEIHAH